MNGNRRPGLLWLLLLLAWSLPAAAAEVHLVSETILRGFERDTVAQDDALLLPAYEYLRADAGALEEEGLSIHLNGWGRVDFGDDDFYEDDTAGELLYGYLRYACPQTSLDLRLGRLYLFEGVANDSVDGLRLAGDLGRYLSFSAYGGFPVGLDSSNGRSGDSVWGGRFAHRLPGRYEIGASYQRTENDSEDAGEMLGVDLFLAPASGLSLYGYSARNQETGDWAEHSYDLSLRLDALELRPYYHKFRYEAVFGTGTSTPTPFPFLRDSNEILEVVGGDVTWNTARGWEFGARAKAYDYRQRGDSSGFYALLLNWRGDGPAAGAEAGLMEGDAAENDYLLGRAYFYWADVLPEGFLSGDVVYVDYDKEIYGEGEALFVSLGAGRRFLDDTLELRLSGDYSSDPFFDSDLRGMLVAEYTYDR